MKIITILFLTLLFLYCNNKQYNEINSFDAVPNADIAINIAVSSFIKIYGKDIIETEKPFHAELKDSIWHVYGSLPSGMTKGGTAEADIIKKTGKIIRIIHGKSGITMC
jgi:hypothetical protein